MTSLRPLLGRVRDLWYDKAVPYYLDLQPREQRLLMAAAVLVPLMVVVFGMLLPVVDQRDAARSRLALLQQQLHTANRLADRLQQAKAMPVPTNVLAEVEKLARSHAVRRFMTRIKPQTDLSGHQKLLLQIKRAPFAKVVRFIDGVTSHGLVIDQVKLQATKQPALVDMRMVLAQ